MMKQKINLHLHLIFVIGYFNYVEKLIPIKYDNEK